MVDEPRDPAATRAGEARGRRMLSIPARAGLSLTIGVFAAVPHLVDLSGLSPWWILAPMTLIMLVAPIALAIVARRGDGLALGGDGSGNVDDDGTRLGLGFWVIWLLAALCMNALPEGTPRPLVVAIGALLAVAAFLVLGRRRGTRAADTLS